MHSHKAIFEAADFLAKVCCNLAKWDGLLGEEVLPIPMHPLLLSISCSEISIKADPEIQLSVQIFII